MSITFWADGKRNVKLQEIIVEINHRKKMVQDTMAYPMRFAVGDTMANRWKRTAVLTFLFLIPALITEIPWLLMAGLIPICMHTYSSLIGMKEPREFRQAERHLLKREWGQARDLIDALIQKTPDYRPARLFLIELKMRLGDFDGAEATLSEIQNDLDAKTIQSIQHDIVLRRRITARKTESIQPSTATCGVNTDVNS
jgi:hypothetical protein